jgi:hypothetical protein
MGKRNFLCHLHEFRTTAGKNFCANLGMHLHGFLFLVIELSRFEQNTIGDIDFPNIVHGAGLKNEPTFFFV